MNPSFDVVVAEMAKGPFQRPDKSLRGQFWLARNETRRLRVRNGCMTGLLVYVLFGILDAVVIPDVAHLVIAGRIVSALATFTLVECAYRRGWDADAMDGVTATCLFGVFLTWIWASSHTVDQEVFAYYILFGNIFMASATLFFTFRVAISFVSCAAMLLVMMYGLTTTPIVDPRIKIVYGCFYLSCFVFAFIVSLRINTERYLTYLNEVLAQHHRDIVVQRGHELLAQSNTDYLTGVENRRSLDGRLDSFWTNWKANGVPFMTALIDVDHFKKFNDGYGHLKGDECLKVVAGALADVARGRGGPIGRYGGEEFMVIAPVADDEDALAFGEKLRSAVEGKQLEHGCRLDGIPIITVSVGLGVVGQRSAVSAERVVAEADQALYAAKEGGRNAVALFDPRNPLHNDPSDAISAILKQALNQSLLSLAYQPIVNLRNGKVEGVEALMRLRSPDGVTIPPCEFIPIAERTGAIVPLGRWAIQTVCQNLLAPRIVPLASVNVSAVQLKTPGFAAQVASILMRSGVPGHRLAFEITEGLQLEVDGMILQTVGELKALGVRIWLDDFGTGFAGLSWLRSIDFDKVKIDKSFLYDADRAQGRMMIEDIITLVRRRGATILVEGVETEDQLVLTRSCGVDEVQGYHLGRPMPLDAIAAAAGRPFAGMPSMAAGVARDP